MHDTNLRRQRIHWIFRAVAFICLLSAHASLAVSSTFLQLYAISLAAHIVCVARQLRTESSWSIDKRGVMGFNITSQKIPWSELTVHVSAQAFIIWFQGRIQWINLIDASNSLDRAANEHLVKALGARVLPTLPWAEVQPVVSRLLVGMPFIWLSILTDMPSLMGACLRGSNSDNSLLIRFVVIASAVLTLYEDRVTRIASVGTLTVALSGVYLECSSEAFDLNAAFRNRPRLHLTLLTGAEFLLLGLYAWTDRHWRDTFVGLQTTNKPPPHV